MTNKLTNKSHEGDVLFKWMGRENIKPVQLAERLGMTRQLIYLRLKDVELPDFFKLKLAMAGFSIPELNVKKTDDIDNAIPLIPIEALAGQGAGELVITDKDIEERFVVPEFTKADYLIRIKGSSMYPKFTAGDIVACQRIDKGQWSYLQWGKAFIIDSEQGVMIKRLFESKKKLHWTLRSDNKDYPDMEMPILAIYNVSMVVGLIRSE